MKLTWKLNNKDRTRCFWLISNMEPGTLLGIVLVAFVVFNIAMSCAA